MVKKEHQKEEISTLWSEQKDDISLSSVMVRFAYAVWGCSLRKSDAIMSKELVDNRVPQYPYLSKRELTEKVASHNPGVPIRYLINVPTQKIEEIFMPDLTELEPVKISHFWGNTGFHPDSSFPSEDTTINEKELKNSANSYMGSVVLIGDDQNPENQKLFIAFRGGRGGHASWPNIRNASKGVGNPDWVTVLDKGKYFSLIRKIPAEKRSNIYNHSGICRTYYSCKPGLISSLAQLGITSLNDFEGKIIISGHSLGGGLATICAYDLRGGFQKKTPALYVNDAEKINCISFSAPAVGNKLFAQNFKKLVPKNLRILINGDPVVLDFKGILRLHHVHGKVCLSKLIKKLELKIVPNHLKFGFIDRQAHQFPKIVELVHIILGKKYIPFVRTESVAAWSK